MGWADFFIVFAFCAISMLVCRVVPLFILKGRSLPQSIEKALGFIPPAAFAALVANDLFSPNMFSEGLWPSSAPLIAALVVVVVALRTKSLLWCGIAGCAAYALLTAI